MDKVINLIDQHLNKALVEKAPFQLPKWFKTFVIEFAPFLAVFYLIIAVPFRLFGLLISLFVSDPSIFYGFNGFLKLVSLAYLALIAFALPGLFNQKLKSWKLILWMVVTWIFLGVLKCIIYFSLINILLALLYGLIILYVLYQIKAEYC